MNLVRTALVASVSLLGCNRGASPAAAPAVAARQHHAGTAVAPSAHGGEALARETTLYAPADGAPATDASAAPDALDSFAHVIDVHGPFVVLSGEPLDAWAASAPTIIDRTGPALVRRAVNPRALPAALAHHAGQRVRLMGPDGEVCEGVLGPMSIVGRAVPHFATVNRWNGTSEDGDAQGAPMPDATIVAEAWEQTDGGRVLGAELRRVSGECGGALWARAATATAPSSSPAVAAEPALRRLAIARMRALPRYREVQRAFVGAGARRGARWEETDGNVDVSVMGTPAGNSLVWLHARAGAGCAEFSGSMVAMWEVSGNAARPRFVLRYEATTPPAPSPSSAVDTDGDGRPEVVFEGAMLRDSGSGYEATSLVVPDHECSC